jgi:uncharacterized protein (DUF362 family)
MDNRVFLYHKENLSYPQNFNDFPNEISKGVDLILDKLNSDKPFYKEELCAGDTIIIKPNLVTTMNYHFELDNKRQEAVTTNPSIIAAVIEYFYPFIGSNGKIIIADSPIEAVDFKSMTEKTGIAALVNYYQNKNYPVELLDIRDFRVIPRRIIHDVRLGMRSFNIGLFQKKKLSGDPKGYVQVDLGELSQFTGFKKMKQLRFYHPHFRKPLEAHKTNKHIYCISRTVLEAKLIINLPKMKTHKISGVTLAMKNNIGLTNKKFWLPHFTAGHPPKGDQFDHTPSFREKLTNWFRIIPIGFGNSLYIRFPTVNNSTQNVKMPIYNGSWPGNDTLWRVVADVAKIIEFSDSNGAVHEKPQRRIINILDGVIAGEGNGPLGASPKKCGLLLGSLNMLHLDLAATRLMGFNPEKLPYLKKNAALAINITSNELELPFFNFIPPERWESLVDQQWTGYLHQNK